MKHSGEPQIESDHLSAGQEIPQRVSEIPVSQSGSVEPETHTYQAPFVGVEAQMPKQGGGNRAVIWALSGALGTIVISVIVFFVFQSLKDPYRTLDSFPATRFLEDYQGVVGSRFRAEVVVDAELGGSFELGRLFSFRDTASQKAIVVLVPPGLSQTSFSKGQTYVTELEVGRGGLIHAHGFKKK